MWSTPSRDSEVWKTPMFSQYLQIKEEVPDILLFYRMGDFYELFGEDAVQAAPVLEVQLTARHKDTPTPVPMCGVPVHALDSYVEKLLGAGHKIALCEQLEDAQTVKTKLLKRGIIRILTPGLPISLENTDDKSAHFLVSLGTRDLAIFDFLRGELFCGTWENFEELQSLLAQAQPKEILYSQELKRNSQITDLLNFQKIPKTPWLGNVALDQLKEYLQFTQRKFFQDSHLLPKALPLSEFWNSQSEDHAFLSEDVMTQWGLFPELFEALDSCGSCLGSRSLKELLKRPLKNPQQIRLRQKWLATLQEPSLLSELLEDLRQVQDLERILGRFRAGAAQPKEFFRVAASLKASLRSFQNKKFPMESWKLLLSDHEFLSFQNSISEAQKFFETLDKSLDLDVDLMKIKDLCELVRPQVGEAFQKAFSIKQGAQNRLENLEKSLQERTGISSLKVRYNRITSFYIEVTKTHLAKIPEDFERRQTLVGGERYTNPELRALEEDVLKAEQDAEQEAKKIFEGLENQLRIHESELRHYIRWVGYLDAWLGIAKSLNKWRRFGAYCYPELTTNVEKSFVDVKFLRHPLLDQKLLGTCVPNSVTLGGNDFSWILLTGPNMSGKSTLMRSLGLALYMAQLGLPVAAESMSFAPVSGFFSRMGARDNILEGESTFMMEMKETASILRRAQKNAFILFDEIGRGTSTHDGVAIARAVFEYALKKMNAMGIFATHYHELSDIAQSFSNCRNASLAIERKGSTLIFLRRLVWEATNQSFGLFVAKQAGLPNEIIRLADAYFSQVTNSETLRPVEQLPLFSQTPALPALAPEEESILREIEELDLDSVSPRETWRKLEMWQKSLNDETLH